jgi:hypothetical protein
MTKIRYFATADLAWQFMRECDDAGILVGYPSLSNNDGKGYSVQYIDGNPPHTCDSMGATRCTPCYPRMSLFTLA